MNILGVIGIIALVFAGSRFGADRSAPAAGTSSSSTTVATSSDSQTISGFDPRQATYSIEGISVTLRDGLSERAIPNSSSKIITRYFGNGAIGDINGDGRNDIAFLITQQTGGSGLFYYAVVALNASTGTSVVASDGTIVGTYRVTNAVLIGDRIAPQPMEVRDGKLLVNYAERKPDEPMTAPPSVGVTKILDVNSQGVLLY